MLLAMILWYAIPVVILVASLFVRSRDQRRKVVYLSAALAAMVMVLVIGWASYREDWGIWAFFVLPAASVTGLRLIIATVVPPEDADR
ncbi:hypothetical protein ABZ917_26175 [Nonomuraea wenchangensis]